MKPQDPALLAAMYGGSTISTKAVPEPLRESTNEFEIKTQTKNFHKIKSGSKEITVPAAKYIKELEDRIDEQGRDFRKLTSDMKKVQRAVDALSRELDSMKKELKNKMDRF